MRPIITYPTPPAEPHAAELRIYTRAWRQLCRAEYRAYRAAQDAARALYFHQSDPLCRDTRARYILAYGAMRARIGQLARRRAEYTRAEETIAPMLRMRHAPEPRQSLQETHTAMKTPKPAGSLEDVRIDTIRNWDNHETCHYCRQTGTYRDSTHVLIGRGILSGTTHSFGLCAAHAIESLAYVAEETLEEAIAAYAQEYAATVDVSGE